MNVSLSNATYDSPNNRYTFTNGTVNSTGKIVIDQDVHQYFGVAFTTTITSGNGYFSVRLGDEDFAFFVTLYHFTNQSHKLELCYNDFMFQTIDLPSYTFGIAQDWELRYFQDTFFVALNNTLRMTVDVDTLIYEADFKEGYIVFEAETGDTSIHTMEGFAYNPELLVEIPIIANAGIWTPELETSNVYFTGEIYRNGVPFVSSAQIQSDWTQSDSNILSFIRNKPTSFGNGDSIPIGTIAPYYGTTLSDASWLICDGATYNRSAYTELANFLGVLPSATTFQVPDLRDRFLKGKGTSSLVKDVGGSETTTLSVANLPPHTHTITDPGHNHTLNNGTAVRRNVDGNPPNTPNFGAGGSGYGYPDSLTIVNNTTGITISGTIGATSTPFTNLPPYTVVNYIIKAYNNQYSTPIRADDYWSKTGSNVWYQSGNVGIATNAPNSSYVLDVNGNFNFNGDLYKYGVIYNPSSSQWVTNGSNVYYSIGNVGIGTISPSQKLDVTGSINFTGDLYKNGVVYNPSTFNGGTITNSLTINQSSPITYLSGTSGGQWIGMAANITGGAYNNKNIYTGGCMRADGGGPGATYTWGSTVGAGNSGGWYVNTTYYGNVEHYFGGRVLINGPCYLASDARIKTDVEDLDESAVEAIISQLQPKKYTYIDKWRKGDKMHYGLIAQEVKTIFPDGCYTFEDFIPNICEIASNISLTEETTSFSIVKIQDIQVKDVLKIHYRKDTNKTINQDVNDNTIDDGQEETTEATVVSITNGIITVDKKIVSEVLFIYGKQAKDVMGINYNNFIPLLITTCQSLLKKNQALEDRLAAIEEKINKMCV